MKKRRLEESAALLRDRADGDIDVAIMLGSGLAGAVFGVERSKSTPYKKLPGMPERMASGHSGVALTGRWGGKRIVAFIGRAHLYQGYEPAEVVFPVALAHAAGARTFIVTNAAGGLNTDFSVGDVMMIADQLNFTGTSIPASKDHDPFVNMTDAYTPHLRAHAHGAAPALGIRLREGTYVGLRGPAYETAAEVRFYRNAGGDAIGMSTVLETIFARFLGMGVLGISLISNVAAAKDTNHADVTAIGHERGGAIADLIADFLPKL